MRRPAVVLAHGYSATHAFHYWRVAERLAEAGFIVLDFDPRHLGASPGEPRQIVRAKMQLDDLRAAIGYLQARPEVYPDRVAIWGSSFGGGLALDVAATDRRVAAAVSVVPQVDGFTNLARVPRKVAVRVIIAALHDGIRRVMRSDPVLIPVFAPNDAAATFLSRDHGWEALQENLEPGGRWVRPGRLYKTADSQYLNDVAAWEVVGSIFYRPARRVRYIRCPVLMIIGSYDSITPPGAQRRAAKRCDADLVELPCRHFDAFRFGRFPQVIDRSCEFLAAHLVM